MVANALRNQVSRLGRLTEAELAQSAEAAKIVAAAMAGGATPAEAAAAVAVKIPQAASADALVNQAHAATKVHKFSDTQAGLDASLPRLPMGDLIDETIVLFSVGEFNGKFGEGSRVVCLREATGERFVLTGNWAVVGDTIRKLADDGELPCRVKVIRAKGQRYFQFTDPDGEPVTPPQGEKDEIPF